METIKKEEVENPIAFPMYNELGEIAEYGMTLRDYFAAKAMQSILSVEEIKHMEGHNADDDKYIAKRSYNMADTMLKQRHNKP